jgi:hypothetical protein
MDESAFRQARGAVNPQPCAFEKALLARCGACSLAERRNIAEREAVACGSQPARERCAALLALLRQNSVFALKLTQADAPLPHAQAMKLQCGGLQGMQRAAGSAAALNGSAGTPASGAAGLAPVADVHGLVQACAEKFGGLQNLPYPVVIQSVVAYAIRRRRPAQ